MRIYALYLCFFNTYTTHIIIYFVIYLIVYMYHDIRSSWECKKEKHKILVYWYIQYIKFRYIYVFQYQYYFYLYLIILCISLLI